MKKEFVIPKGVAPRLIALIMSLVMVLTCGAFLQESVYADGRQFGKICFNGDADYDWAYFAFVEGNEASLDEHDLNITILDKEGVVIEDALEYSNMMFEYVYYDEALEQDVFEPVTSSLGIMESDLEVGFSEYKVTVEAMAGAPYTGTAEARIVVIDKYSLNFFCLETDFENYSSKDRWTMHNRFWFAPGTDIVPIVRHANGDELTAGVDYDVTYYRRSGTEEDMNNPGVGFGQILVADEEHRVDGVLAEPGGYFAQIEGNEPYYGMNNVLIDITDTAPITIRGGYELWSDKDLELDVAPPAGVTGSYRVIVGVRGEDDWMICFADRDNEADYFEFDEASGKLILHGRAIFDEIEESYLNIYVDIKDAEGKVLAEGFADANVREARYEINLPEDDAILPGWTGWIDENVPVWVRNADHPDGFETNIRIENVWIDKDKSDENVMTLVRKDGGWEYRGNDFGTAVLEMTYGDLDDNPEGHSITVNISDTVYHVNVWSENGVTQGLPGTKLVMRAHAEKHTAERHPDNPEDFIHESTSEGLQLNWSLTDGEEFATITRDLKNPGKATVKFNNLPDGWDHIGERVEVKVGLSDSNSGNSDAERADRRQELWVNSEYHQIWPATVDSGLDVGKTLTIKPELRFYRMGKAYSVVDNASFEIDIYDSNAIDISEQSGVFTITRNGEWDTNFRIRANWRTDGRHESRDQWYHLDRKDYNIRFEYDYLDIYNDQEITIKPVMENLDGIMDLIDDYNNDDYKITYTAGLWDPDIEDWDRTLDNSRYWIDEYSFKISGRVPEIENWPGVNVRATLTVAGREMCDTWCWLELKEGCPFGNHRWLKATVKEATCKEYGKEAWICLAHNEWKGCGEVRFIETDYAAHKVTKVAHKDSTLTATGNILHYKCTVCGRLFSDKAAQYEIWDAKEVLIDKKLDISKASVAKISAKTYNKKEQKPTVTVTYNGKKLKSGTDYTVTYANNINAGTAKVTIKGKGLYAGSKTVTFTIAKATNPIALKAKAVTVKATLVAKKNQVVKQATACTISGAQGKVTWKKASGNSKITVASNGNITVKKGLKAGSYKIILKATAAGNSNYKALTKSVTITINVK